MAKKKIGIIGGGISGAGLAYHLSLYEGEADVTVFEKDTIGGASTAKSAGTVCLFDDSLKNRYWDVRLYGFESYLKMEEEHLEVNVRQNQNHLLPIQMLNLDLQQRKLESRDHRQLLLIPSSRRQREVLRCLQVHRQNLQNSFMT